MNIIAGLLRGLAPLPQPDLRAQDEANGEAQAGNGNAFSNVLSGLSQNSAANADGTNSAPQQKPVSIRINPEDVQSEPTDGSAVDAPSSATTVAQTLAALGDLAALTEQNTANALNGNAKPANPNPGANAQQPKDSLTDLFSTGEGQQPGPGTPAPASQTGSARQLLGEGGASALGALANDAASSAQTPNPGSAAPLNKPLANFAQGTINNNQPPDIPAANTGTFGPTGPSLLTNGLAAQIEAPAGGSNQTSGSKDSNKDAGQPNGASSGSGTITTAAFVADAAVIAAALQPTAPMAPTSGGTTGTRGDTDKPGAKSSSAARQSGPPADANTSAGNDQGTASVANLDGVIAANVSASVQPPEPVRQAPLPGTSIPAGASAFAGTGLAAANATSTLAPLSQTAGADADADAPAPIKLAVLSTTTHFAPPAQLSPIQQIATAVAGAIPGLSPASGGTFGAASAAGDGGSTGGIANVSADPTSVALPGPAKVLNLQLEPPNLGTVTISLNLSNGGLDVQMAASQPATANLIERDKTALSDQLRDSGYSVASVAVSLDASANVGNDGSATQGQANQGQANQAFSQNNGQDMSQGGASNGNGSTGQNGPDRSLPDSLAPIPDSIASVVTNGPASGELYI